MKKEKKGAADSVAPNYIYVGPEYSEGIQLPGPKGKIVRPAEFTTEQIEQLIQQYPSLSSWWKTTDSVTPGETVSPDSESQ